MLGSLWRHFENLPVHELDPIVFGEDAAFHHAQQLVRREAVPDDVGASPRLLRERTRAAHGRILARAGDASVAAGRASSFASTSATAFTRGIVSELRAHDDMQ
jgi:hypothetical protein